MTDQEKNALSYKILGHLYDTNSIGFTDIKLFIFQLGYSETEIKLAVSVLTDNKWIELSGDWTVLGGTIGGLQKQFANSILRARILEAGISHYKQYIDRAKPLSQVDIKKPLLLYLYENRNKSVVINEILKSYDTTPIRLRYFLRELIDQKIIHVDPEYNKLGNGTGNGNSGETWDLNNTIIHAKLTVTIGQDYVENKYLQKDNIKETSNEISQSPSSTSELDQEFFEFNRNYYLAGSTWGVIDQLPNFYKEQKWENGHEDKYFDLINSVKPGDIIFIKSAFPTGGISYLRLKAVGVVISNPQDGVKLYVDWKIKYISNDIAHLGKYRSAFARVMPDDLSLILNTVGKQKIIDAGILLPIQIDRRINNSPIIDAIEKLKNVGGKIRNDVVYDNGPESFDVFNQSFVFTIFPKTDFWRFGVRFSKSADFKLDIDSPDRHENTEFLDLHLSAGYPDSSLNWSNPGNLELNHYHFQDNDHVLKRCATYKKQNPIIFQFNHDSEKNMLQVSFESSGGCEKYKTFLKLNDSRYFKIFAWADNIDFEIDFTFEIISLKGSVASAQANVNPSRIATMISDSDRGDDHLDIIKDVNAFSKIMASKNFQPPLAIALFGKWGSGKSFFMNKLRDRIDNISKSDQNVNYCKGIAQIHFNAWSYLDANLWASIVTRIFEGLNEFIKGDDKAKIIKDEIEKDLTQKLTITKEEQEFYIKQKEELESKLNVLQDSKGALDGALQNKINQIKDQKLSSIIDTIDKEFNVSKKIDDALSENASVKTTKEELKKIISEKYWQNPAVAYQEIKSKHIFLKEFFRKDKIGKNLIFIIIILVIILIVPFCIKEFTNYLKTANIIIPQIVLSSFAIIIPVWKRIESTYKELAPLVSAFWAIKEDYEKQIKNALFENEQKEKALKIEIEQSKKEIELIDKQIQVAKETISGLSFKINNALATEALYTFIDKRTNSEDYKKLLGIVSFIRRDFEILSKLFDEHNKESEAEEFRKKFDRPLERIILYIDDLDRCPEDRVIEVLEAVNLLMAFPLFVVVVGVDQRWVKNALIKRYQLQFTGQLNGGKVHEVEKIESSNYLEKIFQVPFHLKEATDDSVKSMLRKLSTPKLEGDSVGSIEGSSLPPIDLPNTHIGNIGIHEFPKKIIVEGETEKRILENLVAQKALPQSENAEYFKLTEEEIGLMQELSGIIGTNPRAIKRFVNVYQIARAHEDFKHKKENEKKEFLILMFLLAMPMGNYRKITRSIYDFVNYSQSDATLGSHIEEYKGGAIIDRGEHAMLDEKTVNQYYNLDAIIKKSSVKDLLNSFTPQECKEHLQFIKRFTFEDAN